MPTRDSDLLADPGALLHELQAVSLTGINLMWPLYGGLVPKERIYTPSN